VNNLTQRMFDDYKPFIKQDHWDEFLVTVLAGDVKRFGDVVRIEDEYYPDSTKLRKRRYTYALGGGRVLERIKATGSLETEFKLAPIPDLIVDKPARKPAMPPKRKPARVAAMEAVPA